MSEEMYADPTSSYRAVCGFLGLDDWTPPAFGANDMAAGHAEIDDRCRRRLGGFFAPRNAELAAYLGRPLPW